MLRNYFKIAFRNLWRSRWFSLINITGLGVGLAAGFLIFPIKAAIANPVKSLRTE